MEDKKKPKAACKDDDNNSKDISTETDHDSSEFPQTFRDVLDGNRSLLIDELQATDQVLDQFNARGVLTDRHVEYVKSNGSRYQRVESLIPILERRNESLLPAFYEVLNETGQEAIADKLRCAKGDACELSVMTEEMGQTTLSEDPKPRYMIEGDWAKLVDELDVSSGRLDNWHELGKLTSRHLEAILENSKPRAMLEGNWVYLVNHLEVSFGLLDHLQDLHALTSGQVEAIRNIKTEYGRAEYLLQFVGRMDESFCKALVKTGQKTIAYILDCFSFPKKLEEAKETKDWITFSEMLKGHWVFTIDNLNNLMDLLDTYLENGVLTERHVEAIKAFRTDLERNTFLVQSMERRDPSLRPGFCRGLKKTGNKKIAEELKCPSAAANQQQQHPSGGWPNFYNSGSPPPNMDDAKPSSHFDTNEQLAPAKNVPPISDGVSINVSLHHRQRQMNIGQNWPVSRLYQEVRQFAPTDNFSLSYQGQPLNPLSNVSDYNFSSGDSVVFTVPVHGGVCYD